MIKDTLTYDIVGSFLRPAEIKEARKDYKDGKWLDLRLKFIQVGRKVSDDGQAGIMAAFSTFSSFGADPGAALSNRRRIPPQVVAFGLAQRI